MIELKYDKEAFQEITNTLVPKHQQSIILEALNNDSISIEELENLAKRLTGEVEPAGSIVRTSSKPKASMSLYEAIKKEVYKALCTNSKIYSEETGSLVAGLKQLIPIISASLASTFGFAAATVSGAISLVIMMALKIGKNAWCASEAPT